MSKRSLASAIKRRAVLKHLPVAILAILGCNRTTPRTSGMRALYPTAPFGFVTDAAHVIDTLAVSRIDSTLDSLRLAKHVDLGVVVLPRIGQYAPRDVATAIGNDWHIGWVSTQNGKRISLGILLLVAVKETNNHVGQCFIATSNDIRQRLSDSTAASLCRNPFVRTVRSDGYTLAVRATVDSIIGRL